MAYERILDDSVQEPVLREHPGRSLTSVKGDAPTILVADDKDENRMLLKDILLPWGFGYWKRKPAKKPSNKARPIIPI